MHTWMIEGIGYLASGLIALSLLMVSVIKLRIINLMGSVAFVAYGGLIGSIPLMITNLFIIGVNSMHLYRLRSRGHGAQYQDIDSEHRAQVEDFAHAYLKDIRKFFPRFAVEQIATAEHCGGKVYAAMRHLKVIGFAVVVPASAAEHVLDRSEAELITASESGNDLNQQFCFLIDYILPRYRGLGLVRGLHELVIHHAGSQSTGLLAVADQRCRKHEQFLRHEGFQPLTEQNGVRLYRKSLGSDPGQSS